MRDNLRPLIEDGRKRYGTVIENASDCPECGKAFARSSDLSKHLVDEHGYSSDEAMHETGHHENAEDKKKCSRCGSTEGPFTEHGYDFYCDKCATAKGYKNEVQNSADSDYKARYAEIERQLDSMKAKLRAHAQRQAKEPLDYGYPGDLGQALVDLKSVHSLG